MGETEREEEREREREREKEREMQTERQRMNFCQSFNQFLIVTIVTVNVNG
jgi:hypothetical protein